jgi:hypothetical protein
MVERKPKKRNYLNNHDLLIEIAKSKSNNKITDKLATMLIMLCDRYAKKSSYASYSYLEDMKSYAMLNICKTWRGFDETLYNNPFAYYTQSIKNSFIQYLHQEKKQRNVKDLLLIRNGLDPSFTFSQDYEDEHHHNYNDYAGEVDHHTPSDFIDDDHTDLSHSETIHV